ncbi:MAG: hypothetical protein ACHQYQ_02870 [Bacteriovoracales bacterium]
MKKLVTFVLLASSLAFIGCQENFLDRGAVNDALDEVKKENPFYTVCLGHRAELFNKDVNGDCVNIGEFDIVWDPADGDHRVVLKRGVEIPFLNTVVWQYYGIDFNEKDHETFEKLSPYEKVEFLANKINDGFCKYGYLGYEPADHDFFYEDEYGRETIFSENVGSVKDVELMGTKVEDQNAMTVGTQLAAKYGLSNERGQVIAKTLAAYNTLTSKRSLTPAEKDQFSNSLMGVDYKTALKGVQSGDAKAFEDLMNQAAKTNETTPEAVSAIVRDMVL